MEFRILGPLEVRDGDRTIPLAGGRQRALLALLILNANETVSTDRLVEELWGERPPATAPKVVQNHVSQLRRALEDEAKDAHEGLLLTQGSGYAFRLEPGSLDLDRFEQLLEEGRSALTREDAQQASEILREALALWRGPPLADFAFEPFAQTEIARLEERRLVALEERIEADLALGRHADLVGELEALIARQPLRERLRGQLMLALYRSGRQSEALHVYQAARRTLVEELGIEPGPGLQQIERSILQQDAALEAPSRDSPSEEEPERAGGVLIGRKRELAALVVGLDGALSGRGRLFLIAGEPGIGKSRLADELAERARERGAVTLFGRAWEAGGAPAYWPWVQAIRTYLRDRDARTVREQLGGGASDVAQMLPELHELVPEVGTPATLDPEGARFRLFDATASFLRNAAEVQPLVLVLDDLHAADTPSLLLLEFIAPQLAEMRVLVLGSYRDTELGPEHPLSVALTELARYAAPQLQLSGLPEAEVARFIEAGHGVEPPPGLAAAIHAETEGNPLFVGEILRLLAAEGRLQEAVDKPGRRTAIPASVRDVIGRRLRHLSDDCKQVLTLASVIGREFELDALLRVSEQELDPLLDLLDEAISGGVVDDVPGAHGRLRFAHVLIRDVLYDELTATRRLRLHRRVGEALEALYAKDPEPHLAELAHHFYEAVPAGDADTAVEYARRAGDRAAALLAYEEAARLYEIGLETIGSHAAGDEVVRCELLLRLGDVQARSGDTSGSKLTYREAAELAESLGLPEQLARSAVGYGGRMIWEVSRDDAYLLPLLEKALAALGDEDSGLRVKLLARLAGGPLRDASFPPERRASLSQEALEIARRIGDPATLAYGLDAYIIGHHSPAFTREQLEVATELVDVAMQAGDKERAVDGHDARLASLIELGDLNAARAELDPMAKLAEELGQPPQVWIVSVYSALLALLEGRFVEAEELISDARGQGERALSWSAAVSYGLQLYVLRREQGRLEEVEELVRRSVADHPTYPIWRCVLAQMEAELSREDESRETFDALAAHDFIGLPFDEEWLVSLSFLAEVAGALGDARAAAVLYEKLLPYAERVAICYPEISIGSVARYVGILAETMGRWESAEHHFRDALETNERIGARPWLAHTQYDYGRMLLARSEPGDRALARELLASAKSLSQELEMDALTDKVSALSNA